MMDSRPLSFAHFSLDNVYRNQKIDFYDRSFHTSNSRFLKIIITSLLLFPHTLARAQAKTAQNCFQVNRHSLKQSKQKGLSILSPLVLVLVHARRVFFSPFSSPPIDLVYAKMCIACCDIVPAPCHVGYLNALINNEIVLQKRPNKKRVDVVYIVQYRR